MYIPINVDFKIHSKSETIVKFDRHKVLLPVEYVIDYNCGVNEITLPFYDCDRKEMMKALNEEGSMMVDTFQIYLQTLISQALDANFLVEISKENGMRQMQISTIKSSSVCTMVYCFVSDEYFLTSMAAVEDHWILPKRDLLKETISTMRKPFQVGRPFLTLCSTGPITVCL